MARLQVKGEDNTNYPLLSLRAKVESTVHDLQVPLRQFYCLSPYARNM